MLKNQILILNILDDTDLEASFDNRMSEVFRPMGIEYDTVYIKTLCKIKRFEEYTHLLISGSIQSATDNLDWFIELDSVIDQFVKNNKSILGICFGHQFLIRHFMGKEHVRRSNTPEVGWTDISISKNPIFKNIDVFKSHVFHFDEVFNLDKRFQIIAHSDRCDVQGFQLKGKPVWGIQFHPDFLYNDMFRFVERQKEKDTNFNEVFCNTSITIEEFKINDLIFKNWIEAK